MEICVPASCTGCGLCSNICPVNAITMVNGRNDFLFPKIDAAVCIKCNQCAKKCPANQIIDRSINVKKTYAAWNKNRVIRKSSSSGGIFSVLAERILSEGGVVVGVALQNLEARHIIVSSMSELSALYGSKYVQSYTGDVYKQVKVQLEIGKKVLFSGTPCQIHAIRQFLEKDYDNLICVDVICHGVPSLSMLHKHIAEVSRERKAKDIKFRYKDPYWDYSYVRVEYADNGVPYQRLTVDDDYFHLFNISFSIRQSCHECHYACTHRQGDITLADYWGYRAHNFKMNNYFGGISLILVNSYKGQKLLDDVTSELKIEHASLENAKCGQKCLSEPFRLPSEDLEAFWKDYRSGMTIRELSEKYYNNKFVRPKFLWLRHLKSKYIWIVKKVSRSRIE